MQNNLKDRTKQFALRVIQVCEALPKGKTADVIGRQLLRCGTSVGANYRAACRARSPAEFIAKMGIVEEECDECLFWMEMIIEAGLMSKEHLNDLMCEADELLAITVSSIKTARKKLGNRKKE
jgi:four helix bundle protein